MDFISKVQQKYKGVRRIERRQLVSKKQPTKYKKDYIHRKKACNFKGEIMYYVLIYQ